MAFDLIHYIHDQTLQQHRTILAEYPKDLKTQYLQHLIAFQVSTLQSSFEVNSAMTYDIIKQQDHHKLHQLSLTELERSPDALNYFSKIQDHFNAVHLKISATLVSELHQLDQNASLGTDGIAELIKGQTEWMVEIVDDWFWESIGKTELKLTKNNKKNNTDFKEIVKEFSKIMQEKNHFPEHSEPEISENLELKAVKIPIFYQILKPIVALLILFNLYNVIL